MLPAKSADTSMSGTRRHILVRWVLLSRLGSARSAEGLSRPTIDGVLLVPVDHPNGGDVGFIFESIVGQRQDRKALPADRPHGFSGRAAHFTVQFSLGHVSTPKW